MRLVKYFSFKAREYDSKLLVAEGAGISAGTA
jgi:hypothetical protein